jgi:hypothetical protein
MQVDRIILALVLVAPATPVLAEKCSVCDFSDEPIVVKPTQSGSAGGLQDYNFSKWSDAGPSVRRTSRFGWKDQQASLAPGEPVTFTAQVSPAPQPGKSDEQAVREHLSLNYEKIVWTHNPHAGSSKPKEIVVVGSKIQTPAAEFSKVDGRHALTSVQHAAPVKGEFGGWISDVERPVVAGRIPSQAAVVPAGAAMLRPAGPATLPGKMDLGAAPALRR